MSYKMQMKNYYIIVCFSISGWPSSVINKSHNSKFCNLINLFANFRPKILVTPYWTNISSCSKLVIVLHSTKNWQLHTKISFLKVELALTQLLINSRVSIMGRPAQVKPGIFRIFAFSSRAGYLVYKGQKYSRAGFNYGSYVKSSQKHFIHQLFKSKPRIDFKNLMTSLQLMDLIYHVCQRKVEH
jgi:hypothetical protein